MTDKIILGIDIGGTKTAIGAFDMSMNLITKSFSKTPKDASGKELIDFFFDEIYSVLQELGCDESVLYGIGIGVPSAVNKNTGKVLFAPNLNAINEIDVCSEIKNRFGVKTVIDNDANCGALAEHRFGAGVGTDNMAYITVSTGIGGGIILNGKLYRGTNGFAGEVGHVIIDMDSKYVCGCKNTGCAEAVASGANIAKRARNLSLDASSVLYKEENIDGEAIARAYLNGEEKAIQLVNSSANAVGTLIYNINEILDLERYVIGGGLLKVSPDYLDTVRERYNKLTKNAVEIVPAKLERDFGIIGAALLLF